MPRFVVLRHETPPHYPRPLHWDLMLEFGNHLATWALPAEPQAGTVVAAAVLGNHRLDYLVLRGPLSDDRGRVSQWDTGSYETLESENGQIVVQLNGKKLVGRVTIRSLTEAVAEVTFDETPIVKR